MSAFRLLLFLLIFVAANAQYRGGFGPRLPESSSPVDYADMLTRNRQVPPGAAIISQSIPTPRPPYDRNSPVFLGSVPEPPPAYFLEPQQPAERFDADLSLSGASSPFSDRNRLFGINAHRPEPRPFVSTHGQLFPFGNRPVIATVTSDLYVSDPGRPIQQVESVGKSNIRVDVPLSGLSAPRDIGRFETNIDRFASDSQISQRERVILPPELSNAPMDAFLRRLEPNQRVRPVVGTQPANANTRLLIAPELTKPPPSTSTSLPIGQGHTLSPERVTPFTTYPNLRNDLFPQLVNHAHEDKRPATGRRVGPQGTFGGGTNEYREDWGANSPKGINDRRRPWEHLPGRFGQEGNRPPNRDYPDVALENLRAGNPPQAEGRGVGDDLSMTDRYAAVPMGRYGPEYPEFTTRTPESRETTTLIGVSLNHPKPLYPEDGTRYRGQQGEGPASSFVGGGFNVPDVPTYLRVPDPQPTELAAGIRPYRGPEEITQSRYRERSDALSGRARPFKLDLLNE